MLQIERGTVTCTLGERRLEQRHVGLLVHHEDGAREQSVLSELLELEQTAEEQSRIELSDEARRAIRHAAWRMGFELGSVAGLRSAKCGTRRGGWDSS